MLERSEGWFLNTGPTVWLIASQAIASTVCLTDTTVSELLGRVLPRRNPKIPCTVDIGCGKISCDVVNIPAVSGMRAWTYRALLSDGQAGTEFGQAH